MNYPEFHHPVYFLIQSLHDLGAKAEFVRDEHTLGCWGAMVNGRIIVWLIDNRWSHERIKEDPAAAELIKRGVLVMCAQKPDAERVGAKWLPLAVTPGYGPPDKPHEKTHDVAFVGYVRDAARMQVLSHVARHFRLNVAQGVFGPSAIEAYWSAKVGLNIPTNYGATDAYDSANMRCFEILATGTPLVTSGEPYLGDLGLGGKCFMYSNINELIEAIRIAIQLPDELAKAGVIGTELAQSRHTYAHRAKQVMEWLQ